jgi:hypothetical protein
VSKKKRKQKTTVYVALEGKREKVFYDFLFSMYKPDEKLKHINFDPDCGGSPDAILQRALRTKNNYDEVYAWFDEDKKLLQKSKDESAKAWGIHHGFDKEVKDSYLQEKYNSNSKRKNPILIVSAPCSIDCFLVQLSDRRLPKALNTQNCKDSFAGIIGPYNSEKDYYETKFTREEIESLQEKLPILKLILSIFKLDEKF